jgi:hypothetical protein
MKNALKEAKNAVSGLKSQKPQNISDKADPACGTDKVTRQERTERLKQGPPEVADHGRNFLWQGGSPWVKLGVWFRRAMTGKPMVLRARAKAWFQDSRLIH